MLEPRLLDTVQRALLRQAFDRHHALAFDFRHRHRARANRLAVDVHGACAALRDAAAVFRSGQSGLLTQRPEERRAWIDFEIRGLSIENKAGHRRAPLRSWDLRRSILCPGVAAVGAFQGLLRGSESLRHAYIGPFIPALHYERLTVFSNHRGHLFVASRPM